MVYSGTMDGETLIVRILSGIAQVNVKSFYTPRLRINSLRRLDSRPKNGAKINNHQLSWEERQGVPCLRFCREESLRDSRNPLLFYIHGGGYVSGPNILQLRMASEIGRLGKREVLMPEYTLAPEGTWKQALDEVIRVYQELALAHPLRPISLMGDSAGAGLALAAAITLRDNQQLPPDKLVLISPWLDALLTHPGIPEVEKRDPCLASAGLKEAAHLYAGETPLDDPHISPIRDSLHGLPPTLMMIGTHDLFVCDCRLFKEKAESAGMELEYREWKDMFHVWPAFFQLLPSARGAVQEAGEFLRRGPAHI